MAISFLTLVHAPQSTWQQSQHRLPAVWTEVRRRLPQSGLLAEALGQHWTTPGKGFRARLALACGASLGLSDDLATGVAVASELVHNASLIHDDLQDGDRHRRGAPALWSLYGADQAINAGDALLSLAFETLAELPMCGPLLKRLGHATRLVIEGQSAEIAARGATDLSLETYISICRRKTGPLLAFPVEASLILAGHESTADARTAFEWLGVAYQFRDDLLDLLGRKGRHIAGRDLVEGKWNAPFLDFVSLASPATAASFRRFLAEPGAKESEVRLWVHRALASGAAERVQRHLHAFVARARQTAEGLPREVCEVLNEAITSALSHSDGKALKETGS